MSKHTPGPWHYCDGGIFAEWDDERDENPLVARVAHCGMNGPGTAEGLANAHLIAGAWELLEDLIKHHSRVVHTMQIPNNCPTCALIAKATGEQS